MVLHETDCGKFTDDVIHYERDKEMKEQSYETFMSNVILLLSESLNMNPVQSTKRER